METSSIHASFPAAETIAAGLRVKLNSSGEVAVAAATDSTDLEIGVAQLYSGKSSYAAGEAVPVRLFFPSVTCVASGAFAVGAKVQRTAAGKVDDTGAGAVFGIAAEAAAADGDFVQIILTKQIV